MDCCCATPEKAQNLIFKKHLEFEKGPKIRFQKIDSEKRIKMSLTRKGMQQAYQ